MEGHEHRVVGVDEDRRGVEAAAVLSVDALAAKGHLRALLFGVLYVPLDLLDGSRLDQGLDRNSLLKAVPDLHGRHLLGEPPREVAHDRSLHEDAVCALARTP